MEWLLLDRLRCTHAFTLKGKRLNATKKDKQSDTPVRRRAREPAASDGLNSTLTHLPRRTAQVYAVDKRLELRACPPMPLLRLDVSSPAAAPPSEPGSTRVQLQSGEFRRLTVKLTNVGRSAMVSRGCVA